MYQHGKRTRRQKSSKTLFHAAFVLGMALVVVAVVLQRDLSTKTNERTTVPIITEIGNEEKDVIRINEPLFTMELPSDWKLKQRVNESYANFYEWNSTEQGKEGRRLLLHIDIMPQSYKVVKLLPLTANGNKFSVGNVSDSCANFAKDTQSGPGRQSNASVEAKWENVSFMCDPIEANQTIGTGTEEGGIAARIGSHTYFFFWEDHNIRPDDKILVDAVKSFQAK